MLSQVFTELINGVGNVDPAVAIFPLQSDDGFAIQMLDLAKRILVMRTTT